MKLDDLDIYKIGHTIQLAAVVYEGEGIRLMIPLPGESLDVDANEVDLEMSVEEWQRFLRQTDLLETEALTRAADGQIVKAIIRKSQRQVDQGISWKVFRRDGYKCRYCGNDDCALTVDHLVTWESGGPTIVENLVAACRRCNKERGPKDYAEWLGTGYYRKVSHRLTEAERAENIALIATLGRIPRVIHQRSR